MNKWMKKSIRTLTYIPIMSPEIIMGVSLMMLFVFARTKIGIPLEMGLLTLILAHITFNIPYVIFNVLPKLRQMDKYAYDAALDLGCNPFQAFYKVVIPEILPGITAGFLMAVTYSLDDFVISYFTSGPTSQTLPIAIWGQLRRRVSPEMNALSTIILWWFWQYCSLATFPPPAKSRGTERRYACEKADSLFVCADLYPEYDRGCLWRHAEGGAGL